jgi:hypothetical protein
MSLRPLSPGLSLALLLTAAGAAPGQIIHRYTFNGNANDSVGTANGTLVNATTSGGQLVLDNGPGVASNTPTGKYVSLPAAAFPTGAGGLTSFSLELFYNWVGQPPGGGQTWNRLIDFNNGTDTTVTPPRQYLFLTPRSGAQPTNTVRYAITQNDPGNEFQVNGTDQSPSGTPTFMALTYDAASTTGTLYVGTGTTLTQVGQNLTTALDPTQLSGITNFWIGRSAFNGDPLYNGTIDQLDIFASGRTGAQVLADFLAGPVPVPEPSALALTGAAALGLAVWRRRRSPSRAPVQSPG